MNKFIAPNVLTLKKVPPVACACPWCYLPCCSATCCGKDWNIHKAKCMPWDFPEVPGPINEEMQNLGLSKPTWIGLPKQVVMKDVRQNKLFSWRHWSPRMTNNLVPIFNCSRGYAARWRDHRKQETALKHLE